MSRATEQTAIAVRGWSRHYETADTRKRAAPLPWVRLQADLSSWGWTQLRARPSEMADALAAWLVILEVAAVSRPRGILVRSGVPLTTGDLSIMSGLPHRQIVAGCGRLWQVGWIDLISWPHKTRGFAYDSDGEKREKWPSQAISADRGRSRQKVAQDKDVDGDVDEDGDFYVDPRSTPSVESLVSVWNEVAAELSLPRVAKINDSRRATARSALREEPDLDVWRVAFYLIGRSDFHAGRNDTGTVYATFDYAIRPKKRGRWLDAARTGDAGQRMPRKMTARHLEEMADAYEADAARLEEPRPPRPRLAAGGDGD